MHLSAVSLEYEKTNFRTCDRVRPGQLSPFNCSKDWLQSISPWFRSTVWITYGVTLSGRYDYPQIIWKRILHCRCHIAESHSTVGQNHLGIIGSANPKHKGEKLPEDFSWCSVQDDDALSASAKVIAASGNFKYHTYCRWMKKLSVASFKAIEIKALQTFVGTGDKFPGPERVCDCVRIERCRKICTFNSVSDRSYTQNY